MADVFHVEYDFQGASYDLRVVGKKWTVHAPMSPFVKLIENSVVWAKQRLEAGKIPEGLKILERCFEMQQADQVVDGVYRCFRRRFVDAYAGEAAAFGKWWAESLYYSDRARQLEPTHLAASAHEKAVVARLCAITFLPGACAGIIVAISGIVGNRPDVWVIGTITPVLLSILSWVLYGRKALNTVFVIGMSLVSATVASVVFCSICSTKYATPEDSWLYSGITGVVLSLVMAGATKLLPKSLRRENMKMPKDVRESLSRAQRFYQKDWEDIKASYRVGPFPGSTGAFSGADRLEAESQIEQDVKEAQKVVLRGGDLLSFLRSVCKASLPVWRLAADNGNPDAQWLYGCALGWGIGCEKAPEEAVGWFRKAAEQGNAAAQNDLAECCYDGRGTVEDRATAVGWFRKAAEQGYADAQKNLGVCYMGGLGILQDYAQAEKWFRKAAKQGHAKAQCYLGQLCQEGNGVPKDDAKAVKWFRKSAEQGCAMGQCFLGNCYRLGWGVSEDWAESFRWLRMAAEQGDAGAQTGLAIHYLVGFGTPENKTEAVKWLHKAAEQGHAGARAQLRELGA